MLLIAQALSTVVARVQLLAMAAVDADGTLLLSQVPT